MTTRQRGELRNLALLLADEKLTDTELDFAIRWSLAKEGTLRGEGHDGFAGIVRQLRFMAETERENRSGRN